VKRKQNRTSARRANATAKIAQLQALTEEMDRLRVSARLSSSADLMQREIIKWNEEKARKAQLAQEAQRRAASPTRSAKKNPLPRERTIIKIISEDSTLRGMVYCAALDSRKVPTAPAWRAAGCPMQYVPAYKSKKWRKRIQDEKYRLTRPR
jgi:hypothetical protein